MKYPFTPALLDAIPEGIAEIYRALELTLLEEIAVRLMAAEKLNEVTVQNIRALRAQGVPLKEIKEAIKKTTGASEKELEALFSDVAERNQEYYGGLADLAGITAPERIVGAADVAAIFRQTWSACKNITGSMGFLIVQGGRLVHLPPAKAYQWALDQAAVEVESGAVSYGQAISRATRKLADAGLTVVDYESGHADHVDVAVRRAVMTGISQVCDKYTEQTAELLDSPYVEVSAHSGARDKAYPNPWSSHKDWQGKVYYQSRMGEPDPLGKYPDLASSTGYGEVDGLCGANCRHIRYVWVEGVSERTYTDEELAGIDPPDFEYQGATYTHYEATQKQREIERTVRKWKRREAAATNPQDKQTARIRLRRLRKEYKDFSEAAGLRMQPERMKVYIPKG